MDREMVYATLVKILTSHLGMDENRLDSDSYDLMLTGDCLRQDDVSMVYLFCEVEKAFGIRIPREMLDDYGFSTINKIADIVIKLKT
ncbi:MAG: hypothetical protein FWB88_05740 [Defluviitaleaceae bacterium]|nr:hypothetical protein [Defluviitaleaceae bacterium]MCL2239881.1 hypothetical protein [Defluviitaleaceae bacterium]